MSNVIMCSECKKCDGDRCNYFDNDSDRESTIACILFESKNPTVFDRITASIEVLADKFIFKEWHPIARRYVWYSLLFNSEERLTYAPAFGTKPEALAATVARLKEVEK